MIYNGHTLFHHSGEPAIHIKEKHIFLIAFIIWALIYFIAPLRHTIDNEFIDVFYYLNHEYFQDKKTNNDIVIVDIDDDSMWVIDRPDKLADIILALGKAGAEVIGVDISFDDYKNPPLPGEKNSLPELKDCSTFKYNPSYPYEYKLACTLEHDDVSNVVLGMFVSFGEKKEVLKPLQIFQDRAWALGHLLVPKRQNYSKHRAALLYYSAKKGEPSVISFPLAVSYYIKDPSNKPIEEEISLGGTKIFNDNGFFYPYLLGPGNNFKYFTIKKFLKNIDNTKLLKKTFEGKIVLIGSSSFIADDLLLTPFSRFYANNKYSGKMPGVEFHANTINSLLKNKYYTFGSLWQNLLWALVTIFLAIWALLYTRKGYGAFYVIGLILINLALAFWAFQATLTIFSAGTLCCITLISIPLVYIYKFMTVDKMFGRYVSPDVAEEIWKNRKDLFLKGKRKVATVVFSDIRGFTSLSEKIDPELTVKLLNDYFEVMSQIIYDNGGNLNKFIGDGLMLLYGAPISANGEKEDAINAVKSSIEMIKAVEGLNKKWAQEGIDVKIEIGVGINTGLIVAGNIGCSKRVEYSAIGDTVNLASRLEGLNKQYKTNIIVSQSTCDKVKDTFKLEYLDDAKVKGKEEIIKIYSLKIDQ